MFIIGLIVGPALGLVAGLYLLRSRSINLWLAGAAVVAVTAAVVFLPVADLELRLGLAAGLLLGLLLSLTSDGLLPSEIAGPETASPGTD